MGAALRGRFPRSIIAGFCFNSDVCPLGRLSVSTVYGHSVSITGLITDGLPQLFGSGKLTVVTLELLHAIEGSCN